MLHRPQEIAPTFSLVVSTLGRTRELAALFESLERQTNRDFEVILVDQNPPGFLDEFIAGFSKQLKIRRMRSTTGLSHGRNVGMQYARGRIVAFPDDDCWYPEDLLARVDDLFAHNPNWSGIVGRPKDPHVLRGFHWFDSQSGIVSVKNLWNRCSTFTIFLRRTLIDEVGDFDELLGCGSGTDMSSAEEADYMIRALRCGFEIYYRSDLQVFHRYAEPHETRQMARIYGDALSIGYVCRKYGCPFSHLLARAVRSLAVIGWSLVTGRTARANYHRRLIHGICVGWFQGRKLSTSRQTGPAAIEYDPSPALSIPAGASRRDSRE